MYDSDCGNPNDFREGASVVRPIADAVWLNGHIDEFRLWRHPLSSPPAPPGISICRRGFPGAGDRAARCSSTLHDRQAVRNLAVAAAELDGDRSVRAFLRRDAVERIGIVQVLLEITLGVVKADRPERVDWHVGRDVEPIDRVAVVPGWGEARIARVLVRITAPTGGGSDQMFDRINLLLWCRMRS